MSAHAVTVRLHRVSQLRALCLSLAAAGRRAGLAPHPAGSTPERGLRFHDPETGQDLPNLAETDEARRRESQARQAAETRLAQEAAARQQEAEARAAAEARVAELEVLLRRERGNDSDQ